MNKEKTEKSNNHIKDYIMIVDENGAKFIPKP